MHRIILLAAALAWGIPLCAQGSPGSPAPAYTEATIVNSATSTANALAPNTLATIYGSNLTDGTIVTVPPLQIGAMLPVELAGVHVDVAGSPACLYYVSPQQINFLVPSDLRPGDMDVFVSIDGLAGAPARITLHEAAPGMFQSRPGVISATHADGSLITAGHPARRGETVTVYGTGLGATMPPVISGMAVSMPAEITNLSRLHVLANGTALSGANILFAGLASGSPGLYRVTFKLPKSVGTNPEIRITIGSQSSQKGLKLPLQ